MSLWKLWKIDIALTINRISNIEQGMMNVEGQKNTCGYACKSDSVAMI